MITPSSVVPGPDGQPEVAERELAFGIGSRFGTAATAWAPTLVIRAVITADSSVG